MAVETTGDALALAAETERLLHRATEAVGHVAYFGPKKLGAFIGPVERLRDALAKELPEMETLIRSLRS